MNESAHTRGKRKPIIDRRRFFAQNNIYLRQKLLPGSHRTPFWFATEVIGRHFRLLASISEQLSNSVSETSLPVNF